MTKRISQITAAIVFGVLLLGGVPSHASNPVLFNGAGASVLFNTFALAAYSNSTCGTNIWTYKKGGSGIDSRAGNIPAEVGNIWIVWNTAGTTVCSFLSIDATVGAQLFFAVPTATLSISSSLSGSQGQNLVPGLTDTTLPASIYNAINGQAFNAALLDSRPEDALFAENRVLGTLDTVHYNGLGYGPGPVGTAIQSSFSSSSATPVIFAISGDDPITGLPVPAWTTLNVGAAPIIIFVNTEQNNSNGDFSNANAFQNVNRFDLTETLNGTYGYTRDIASVSGLTAEPLNVILREPLAGAMNVLEFNIPRAVETASTQELGVNPGATGGNPLNIATYSGGWRKRALSSSEEVAQVGNASNGDSIGYTFWSTGNFANVIGSTRYLTVDGVDPLFPSYSGGTFPDCSAGCQGEIPFTNILNGSYPIWSVFRVATAKKVPAGVQALVTAAQNQAINAEPDFIPFNQLAVFHSHYNLSGAKASNGFCTKAEAGGDIGGAVFTVQADQDFCAETGKELTGFKQ